MVTQSTFQSITIHYTVQGQCQGHYTDDAQKDYIEICVKIFTFE